MGHNLGIILDALIVEPNPYNRGFLWQATLAETHFRKVKAVSSMAAALERLSDEPFDVLLLPSTIPNAELKDFIHSAKERPGGKEAAYILVLKTQDQSTENVATGIIDGTDGFLLEPYSVSSLRQVAMIAAKVKGEYERKRKEAATKLLISDMMRTLDEYALAVRKDKGAMLHSKEKKSFQKAASTLKRVNEKDRSVYYDLAPEMFEAAPPRVIIYKGASKRLKKLLNSGGAPIPEKEKEDD